MRLVMTQQNCEQLQFVPCCVYTSSILIVIEWAFDHDNKAPSPTEEHS